LLRIDHSDLFQGLGTIDSREIDIHQDHVGFFLFDLLQPFLTGRGNRDVVSFITEELLDNFQGIGCIIHDEDFPFSFFRRNG
jgi:hypothetical protein